MKKKIILAFILLLSIFSIKSVYAEGLPCTWLEDLSKETGISVKRIYQSTTGDNVRVGDKIIVTFDVDKKIEGEVDYRLFFQSTTDENDLIYVYVKDVKPVTHSDGKTYSGYYIVPENAKVGSEYRYRSFAILVKDEKSERRYTTPSGKEVVNYDLLCGRYYFDENDSEFHKFWNGSFLSDSFTKPNSIKVIGEKEPEQEIDIPGNNVLKSLTVDRSDVYVGGIMKITGSATVPIAHLELLFGDENGNTFSTILLGNISKDTTFTAEAPAPGPRSTLPEGKYYLKQIYLYKVNSGSRYAIYRKNYERENLGGYFNDYGYEYPLPFDMVINLKRSDTLVENQHDVAMLKLKLQKDTATIGAKVPLTFEAYANKKVVKSVHINFYDVNTNAMFSSYLKSLDKDSYFTIPSIAKEGTYKIESVVFVIENIDGENDTIVFKNTVENENYKDVFAQELKVIKENSKNVLYFATEDLDEIAYETIKNSQENSIIIVDAEYQTVIPAELFDVIKETQRQLIVNYKDNEWIINGIDVEESKSIDVSMKFYSLEDSDISSEIKNALGDKAILVEFPENGQLPGMALVRLKDDEISELLKKDRFFVYYVDEENNKLNKVALELQKSYDGYIEFYINHNSKYVISLTEVEDDSILGEDDSVLSNNTILVKENDTQNSNTLLLYVAIGVGAFIILLLIIIIIMMGKKSKKENKSVEKSEDKKTDEE